MGNVVLLNTKNGYATAGTILSNFIINGVVANRKYNTKNNSDPLCAIHDILQKFLTNKDDIRQSLKGGRYVTEYRINAINGMLRNFKDDTEYTTINPNDFRYYLFQRYEDFQTNPLPISPAERKAKPHVYHFRGIERTNAQDASRELLDRDDIGPLRPNESSITTKPSINEYRSISKDVVQVAKRLFQQVIDYTKTITSEDWQTAENGLTYTDIVWNNLKLWGTTGNLYIRFYAANDEQKKQFGELGSHYNPSTNDVVINVYTSEGKNLLGTLTHELQHRYQANMSLNNKSKTEFVNDDYMVAKKYRNSDNNIELIISQAVYILNSHEIDARLNEIYSELKSNFEEILQKEFGSYKRTNFSRKDIFQYAYEYSRTFNSCYKFLYKFLKPLDYDIYEEYFIREMRKMGFKNPKKTLYTLRSNRKMFITKLNKLLYTLFNNQEAVFESKLKAIVTESINNFIKGNLVK